MHIVYFSPAWPPGSTANGIVTYIAVLRDYLLKQGHDVSVLADEHLHRSDGSVIELSSPKSAWRIWPRIAKRLDQRMGHQPFAGRRLMQQVRKAKTLTPFDLVEMEESFGWSSALERGLDIPVVTRLHGPWFMKPPGSTHDVGPRRSRHRERAEGRAICAATALSAPSRAVLNKSANRYGRSRPGTVIPNPVLAVPEQERWKIEECDRDLLLFVGRLDRPKGADTLIAAFARVLETRPETRLEMVGPDVGIQLPDGSVKPFAEYARQTLPPAALAQIRFSGLLQPDEVRRTRRRAFLTVVASLTENFPYTAVEAMSLGCPLLSTEWLGASDIIAHGQNGWLTPLEDPESMANRIAWVFQNPAVAAATGAAAWRHCRDAYVVEEIGAQMISFYQDVLARHAV